MRNFSRYSDPASSLAQIKSSSEVYGYTSSSGVFGARIPIAGIVGDQHAALLGQLCFNKGESKTTYGTGNFALINTGTDIIRSKKGLLTTLGLSTWRRASQVRSRGFGCSYWICSAVVTRSTWSDRKIIRYRTTCRQRAG